MLIEAGIFATILAAGKFADSYSTAHAKARVSAWIETAQELDWHNFVAEKSYLIYTAVFGNKAASRTFILRSALLYVALILGSIAFFWLFYPATYASVISVWRFGRSDEIIWWLAFIVLGGGVYALANAQTLYFLEILRTAPNFFRFFLVAYGDVLITASIALLGVPLLLVGHAAVLASTGERVLSLNVRFGTEQFGSHPVQGRADQRGMPERPATADGVSIEYLFADPGEGLLAAQIDTDAMSDATRRGQVRQEESVDPLAFMRELGRTITRPQPSRPWKGVVLTTRLPQQRPRGDFCQNFPRQPAAGEPSYMLYTLDRQTSREVANACKKRATVPIVVAARINTRNIDYGALYKRHLVSTLEDMIRNVTSGFQSYLIESPYGALGDTFGNAPWRHNPFFDRATGDRENGFDEMLFHAYLYDAGTGNQLSHRGYPAGSVLFAVMTTALFNIAVIATFFLLYPLIVLLWKQKYISRYVALESSPFTLIALVIALWVFIFGVLVV